MAVSGLFHRDFSLRSNLIANFAGNALVAVILIVSVPLYLPYIGIEAYGLVGFFVAFQAILSVLDLGLSVTLTRELAVRTGEDNDSTDVRDLVRTTEIIYWGMALLIGVICVAAMPYLIHLVNPQSLSPATLRDCFLIMSVALALQFPIGLYSGGLYGLQKQALLSGVNVVYAVVRNLGVLAVLHFVSATPQTFFAWQALSAGLHAVTLAGCLWLALPKGSGTAQFRSDLLKGVWRFTAGIGAIAIVSVLITQIDKVVLIQILPLETFGYYAIAAVVAGSLQRLIQPVFQVYFPKLSQVTGKSEGDTLAQIYHQGCQMIAVMVLPVAAMFVFFSWEIMFLWQRDAETVNNTYILVSLLVSGSALNALLFIPYALQLAHGWTKLQLIALTSAVVLSVPLTVFLATHHGAVGAATVWIIFNTAFILLIIPIMHRHILGSEMWKWYWDDVCLPLIGSVGIGLLGRSLFVANTSEVVIVVQLGLIFLVTFLVTCLVTPYSRRWLLNKFFSKYSSN